MVKVIKLDTKRKPPRSNTNKIIANDIGTKLNEMFKAFFNEKK